MRKQSLFLMLVCLLFLATTAGAQTYHVLDTGDPSGRVCNPRSYTDLGNGIVRDNTTGLEWQQATVPVTYNWQTALDYVTGMNSGTNENYGYTDWRLPTIYELATLVDSNIPSPGPTINTFYFSDTQANNYWSSTTCAYSTPSAWVVNFYTGRVEPNGKIDTDKNIRAGAEHRGRCFLIGIIIPGYYFRDCGCCHVQLTCAFSKRYAMFTHQL